MNNRLISGFPGKDTAYNEWVAKKYCLYKKNGLYAGF